mmetsp:Transcript_52146/g.117881  ORF Transcript_52146/g.117881 Transcript_52146/m.117881 type:complete len:268 (-) Transcript_52146:59-862(-)
MDFAMEDHDKSLAILDVPHVVFDEAVSYGRLVISNALHAEDGEARHEVVIVEHGDHLGDLLYPTEELRLVRLLDPRFLFALYREGPCDGRQVVAELHNAIHHVVRDFVPQARELLQRQIRLGGKIVLHLLSHLQRDPIVVVSMDGEDLHRLWRLHGSSQAAEDDEAARTQLLHPPCEGLIGEHLGRKHGALAEAAKDQGQVLELRGGPLQCEHGALDSKLRRSEMAFLAGVLDAIRRRRSLRRLPPDAQPVLRIRQDRRLWHDHNRV